MGSFSLGSLRPTVALSVKLSLALTITKLQNTYKRIAGLHLLGLYMKTQTAVMRICVKCVQDGQCVYAKQAVHHGVHIPPKAQAESEKPSNHHVHIL